MTVSEEHESVILGTSPVLLIEGLIRARAGQAVTFVESNPSIGGAWAVADAFQLQDIEAACHLIVNYRGVYQFLSESCGLAMEKTEPRPLLYRGGKLTAFDARWHVARRCGGIALRASVVSLIRTLEMMTANQWRLARTQSFSLRQAALSLADHRLYRMLERAEDRAICYFAGGAPAMLRQLVAELLDHGAKFVQAKAIHARIREGEPIQVLLSGDRELTAKELVVSESAEIKSIETNSEVKEFSPQTACYPAIFILVDHLTEQTLSYIELKRDPFLKRVSDVTPYCQGSLPKNNRVLVFEYSKMALQSPTRPAPEVLIRYLKTLKLLPEEARIAEFTVQELYLNRSEPALFKFLRGLKSSSMTVVRSRGDFSMSVHHNLRRWRRMMASARLTNRSDEPHNAEGKIYGTIS